MTALREFRELKGWNELCQAGFDSFQRDRVWSVYPCFALACSINNDTSFRGDTQVEDLGLNDEVLRSSNCYFVQRFAVML